MRRQISDPLKNAPPEAATSTPEVSSLEAASLSTPRPADPSFPQNLTPAQRASLLRLAPKAGETRSFQALSDAVFVGCPSGSFRLGSDKTDAEAYTWETPAQEVTLTRGFFLLQTPVTQAQWQALVGFNPSHFKEAGPDAPVERVSWFEALWFCNLLSKNEGLPPAYRLENIRGTPGSDDFSFAVSERIADSPGYRLPTEAEWEYACRAGTTTPRYGNLHEIAWWGAYDGDGNAQVTFNGGWKKGRKKESRTLWGTHPVGQKQPNAWGLFDMLGNVWEWCFDGYEDSYMGLPTSDPLRTSEERLRVNRGGSWYDGAKLIRSASRYSYPPAARHSYLGFRVLRYEPLAFLPLPLAKGQT